MAKAVNIKKLVVPLIAVGLVIAVVAVSDDGGGNADEPSDNAIISADQFNIAVQDPTLVAEGEVLYQASCALCHGSDLRGTEIGPSHLSVVYQPGHHSDIAFTLAARNGVRSHHWRFGDMAPVEGLSDADLERITAFVRETQLTNGFEPYPPG
jgi:mono/diheme cytochrome c family protein